MKAQGLGLEVGVEGLGFRIVWGSEFRGGLRDEGPQEQVLGAWGDSGIPVVELMVSKPEARCFRTAQVGKPCA